VYFSGPSTSVYFSKRVNGKWSAPKIATFSGRWEDIDQLSALMGKECFFLPAGPWMARNKMNLKKVPTFGMWIICQETIGPSLIIWRLR
jgi:hypothetical protein